MPLFLIVEFLLTPWFAREEMVKFLILVAFHFLPFPYPEDFFSPPIQVLGFLVAKRFPPFSLFKPLRPTGPAPECLLPLFFAGPTALGSEVAPAPYIRKSPFPSFYASEPPAL